MMYEDAEVAIDRKIADLDRMLNHQGYSPEDAAYKQKKEAILDELESRYNSLWAEEVGLSIAGLESDDPIRYGLASMNAVGLPRSLEKAHIEGIDWESQPGLTAISEAVLSYDDMQDGQTPLTDTHRGAELKAETPDPEARRERARSIFSNYAKGEY